MLIDRFLPAYNLASRYYSIDLNAPIEDVYPVVRKLDASEAYATRFILFLRSIPALVQGRPALGHTLDELDKMGFFLLAEEPPQELLLGFVGRLWTSHGDLKKVAPAQFVAFTTSGYVKGVISFTLTPLSEGRTRLTTVSKSLCLCEDSLRKMRRYWFFMAPVSGAVRLGMLRACKRQVERKSGRLFPRTWGRRRFGGNITRDLVDPVGLNLVVQSGTPITEAIVRVHRLSHLLD